MTAASKQTERSGAMKKVDRAGRSLPEQQQRIRDASREAWGALREGREPGGRFGAGPNSNSKKR